MRHETASPLKKKEENLFATNLKIQVLYKKEVHLMIVNALITSNNCFYDLFLDDLIQLM